MSTEAVRTSESSTVVFFAALLASVWPLPGRCRTSRSSLVRLTAAASAAAPAVWSPRRWSRAVGGGGCDFSSVTMLPLEFFLMAPIICGNSRILRRVTFQTHSECDRIGLSLALRTRYTSSAPESSSGQSRQGTWPSYRSCPSGRNTGISSPTGHFKDGRFGHLTSGIFGSENRPYS